MFHFLNAVIGGANAPTSIKVASETPAFTFEPGAFLHNLRYMGIGMLVIFVVIGIIVLTTMLINWLFADKKK